MPPQRRAGQRDVELAEVQLKITRSAGRMAITKRCVPVLWILAFGVVVRLSTPVAKALAGKHTNLSITFSFTIGITIVVSAGLAAVLSKNHKQSQELTRLRERLARYEEENKRLKEGRSR